MQANSAECHTDVEPMVLGATSSLIDGKSLMHEDSTHPAHDHPVGEPSCFHGHFTSCMEMYANAKTVADYLDAHRTWFPRCAQPMSTEPIGETGYGVTIGRFGSFGYEVEPKVGLDLLPQEQGVYRIQTVPVPGYHPQGYDVDFRAALELVEIDANASGLPDRITHVEWELNLEVMIHFPRFIQALPKQLVQTTGDRLLNQIVRQVSRRLTHKVQQDFHQTAGIPFPKRRRK
ncbi:DUF1997 domain-containing protein [Egbenema bharatensis]|uniref:DUF1997 domain-containing protein n=1 Tax=Egbenema bharatensis TaxID=3463334 RepID=UPI003A87D62F